MPRHTARPIAPGTADDLDGLVRLLRYEEVRRYLCDDSVLPREAVAAMLARGDQLNPQGLGLWVIEHMSKAFVGIAGLEPVSADACAVPAMAGGVEPIIAVDPGFWGQGLACEALSTLIDYARASLGLSRLVGAVDRPNARSNRLMQRCGFAVMGRPPGPAHELELYELRFGETLEPER